MKKKKKQTSTSRTAKPRQSRSWMLTVSEEKHSREEVEEALKSYTYVGQLEEGKGGYRHFQIVIQNESPIRFETLNRKLHSAHIQPRWGTLAEAVAYCTKEESRVTGSPRLENGVIPSLCDESGRRSDLERIRDAILEDGRSVDEVIVTMPEAARYTKYVNELAAARDRSAARGVERDVEVIYVYGDPGVGKTRWLYETYDDVCRVTSYMHPFDSYSGQKVLALDEFTGASLDLRLFNNLADRYALDLPARYYDRPAQYETLVVLSNLPPWHEEIYGWEQPVFRKAFARRLHRVLMIDSDGQVQEVDVDSVRSRFGLVNSVTPVAALEAVPAVIDGEEGAAVLPLEIREVQPPF